MPYGPEVSWPSGFRAAEFDSGEYRALVESSYERDEYSHVDPRLGGTAGGDRRQPYGDQGHGGDQRYAGDQRQGGQPGRGRPAEDHGYGDPGYGDPGYADPRYDGPRGYQPQPPARPEYRQAPAPPAPEPIYPVTGAQEVYREPYPQPQPRAVDPRLAGLRYDELHYDDADVDERGRSRYDEPLDDDAWVAELRGSGPAQPQRPAGGGYGAGGNSSGGNGPGGNGPGGRAPGSGSPAYGRADYPPAGPGPSGGGHPSGGPNASFRPGGPAARSFAPGNGPGPRMGALPAGPAAGAAMPAPSATGVRPAVKGLPWRAGSAAASAPSRPQAPAFTPSPDRGFVGAPVAPVGVLTPPAGNRYDSDFTGPETVAWNMAQEADSGEIEVLEEYWEQDGPDDEYTALLADLDGDREETRRDTGAQPAMPRQGAGRRRGRSGDRRLWFGLGGVMAVAAAAIFLIIQFEFPSAGGPAHTLSMPGKIGSSYVHSNAISDKERNTLHQDVMQMTHNQATDVLSGGFESGGPTTGGTVQVVLTVDAHLAGDDPAASVASFEQEYKNAVVVSAGPLGGEAVCAESAVGNANDVAICAWFDNDSLGVDVSNSMNAHTLAGQLPIFRAAVEHVTKN